MKVKYAGKIHDAEVTGPDELGNYFVQFEGGPNLNLYEEEFEVLGDFAPAAAFVPPAIFAPAVQYAMPVPAPMPEPVQVDEDDDEEEIVTIRKLTENQMYILEEGILRYDDFKEEYPDIRTGKTFVRGPKSAITDIAMWADDLSPEDTGLGYIEGSGMYDLTEAMEDFGMAQKWRTIFSLQAKAFKAAGMREEAFRAKQRAKSAQRGRIP